MPKTPKSPRMIFFELHLFFCILPLCKRFIEPVLQLLCFVKMKE